LRDTSQHAFRTAGILQPAGSFDEADCQPGTGQRRIPATETFVTFDRDPDLAGHIICLLAAQSLGGFFIHGCIHAAEHPVTRTLPLILALVLLAACAGGQPKMPFPAFIQSDELEDVFLASLPGVRAKQLAGDPLTRRTSNRIDLPRDWQGTSGGVPGRSMEIFVLAGSLMLADIELGPGGYAYLPAGSLGFNLQTIDGARILYFVNDADPEAVIRSPIILNSELLPWEPTTTRGIAIRELRKDPGSGAMTWLLRIDAGATMPWQSSSVLREGYLVGGTYQHAECVAGEPVADVYGPGGYFYRPANTVNGGPLSRAETDSVWLLRESSGADHSFADGCPSPAKGD
jgi:hypothetical protein